MNYEIKLYAHGVPKGQSSWGVEKSDNNYIDSFYGRKSNVPANMLVEVRQFGSVTNCYYTYYVGNTSDNSGRTGGYLALTLRINYYYADIQNIYNLLEAAFNKFMVGSIVTVSNGGIKYLVADFVQADATLKALEQELNKYLMQFSSNSDFVSLSGFKANGQNEAATLNLIECDTKVVANHVKNYSSISVSPYHPSSREQKIMNEMKAKVNEATTQAQQQITEAQQNAQRDVNTIRTQAQKEIAAAQHDKETGIQAIRNEYKDADKTISGLRRDLDKANKEIVRLSGVVNELNLKVQNAEAYKRKFDESQKQLEKANTVLAKVRDNLSGLSGIAELLGMPSSSSHGCTHGGDSRPKEEKDGFSFMKIVRGIHPFTDFFVMIALLGIVGFTLPKSCEGVQGSSTELIAANERIKQLEKQLEELQSGATGGSVAASGIETGAGIVEEHQPTLAERFPNARIDVAGISAQKPMKYGSADTYTVSLKNVEGDLGGDWESSDFAIYNGNLTPKHAGACKISYVVNGVVLVTRTITVAE